MWVERNINVMGATTLDKTDQTRVAIALVLYNEIASDNVVRTPPVTLSVPVGTLCGAFTAMYFDYTKSSAVGGLNNFVNTVLIFNSNCSTVWGQDSGCVWGDYGCVATQSFDCSC